MEAPLNFCCLTAKELKERSPRTEREEKKGGLLNAQKIALYAMGARERAYAALKGIFFLTVVMVFFSIKSKSKKKNYKERTEIAE